MPRGGMSDEIVVVVELMVELHAIARHRAAQIGVLGYISGIRIIDAMHVGRYR